MFRHDVCLGRTCNASTLLNHRSDQSYCFGMGYTVKNAERIHFQKSARRIGGS